MVSDSVMPTTGKGYPPAYVERLRVPARWWVIATLGVLLGGAEVFAGFDWHVALVVYAVLGIPTAAFLLSMSRTTVRVDAAGLHAGGHLLPRSTIVGVRPLGADETRRRLGPQADPAAFTFVRGYVRTAVLVQTRNDDGPAGSWLVSTRHPDRLAEALRDPVSS